MVLDDTLVTPSDDTLQYRLRPADKELYQKIYNIAIRQGRPVSYKDFAGMKHGTFRNRVLRLRRIGWIEKAYQSSLAFYKPVDIAIVSDRLSSNYHMGGKAFGQLLEELHFREPAIHDIRLSFHAPRLYEYLLRDSNQNLRQNPVSKDIMLPVLAFDNGTRVVRITVHRSGAVSVQVGCSEYPVVIDYFPLFSFFSMLGEVRAYLQNLHNDKDLAFKIPETSSWLLAHCHLNRDTMVSVAGERFNITLEDACGQFLRVYVKKFQDNSQKLRIEESIAPQKPLFDVIKEKLHV